ncbi:MAG TPA: hypothetical protein VIF57_22050 [Polyangia bacterium]
MTNLNLNPISDATRSAPAPAGTDGRMEIDATRGRQTQPPATPFRSVLAGGVSLLMTGAEVATHVVGGPVLAAAVHDARVGATNAIAGAGPAGAGGTLPAAPAMAGAAAATAATGGNPEMAGMEAMMQQGQMSNLQLLALQQQVQQENQQFTTVSNVMRAKHDTAKAAVSNIRA